MSTSSSVATCDSTTLSALLTDQYIEQCQTDSGYAFTAASIPTQDVIDLMCASASCRGLLADAKALDLSECILPVGDNILLLADLIDYVPARCPSASGSAATAGSTTTTATAGSTSGNTTASSSDTVTVPSSASSAATSAPSSGSTASSSATSASAAASASAASASSGSSAAASPVGRAMGLVTIAALAVATCCM